MNPLFAKIVSGRMPRTRAGDDVTVYRVRVETEADDADSRVSKARAATDTGSRVKSKASTETQPE